MDLIKVGNNAVDILRNNKEKIILGAGIAAGGATVFFACKGTLKAVDIVKKHNASKAIIKRAEDLDPEYKASNDHKIDIVKMYTRTGSEIFAAYAPAFIFGTTSVACLIVQHKMMENKVAKLEETVASLSAAYLAVSTAFKKYRAKVVEKYGEEEDRNLRYDIQSETVSVTSTDEKGKTKTKKVKVDTVGDLDVSDYAKFFDGTSNMFIWQDAQKHTPDWDRNISFLKITQSYANTKLETQGYLLLNDVYDMLDIPKTKAGQVVGWIFDPENKSIDSQVSFGIFNPINHRTINGYEDECILLDFNVDGVIIDKITSMADH